MTNDELRKEWTKPTQSGRERGVWVYLDAATLQAAGIDTASLDRLRFRRYPMGRKTRRPAIALRARLVPPTEGQA